MDDREDVVPVADIEVGDNEGKLGQGEEEGGDIVGGNVAEVELAGMGQGLVGVGVVPG